MRLLISNIPDERESLREYANENEHGSLDDAVVALLYEHELLIVTQRKCELLEQILAPYKLHDEEEAVL